MSFPPPCDCSVSGRRASSLPSAVGAPEAALLTLQDCRGLGPERRKLGKQFSLPSLSLSYYLAAFSS